MIERLAESWHGWQSFNTQGKFMALLLAMLLYLWIGQKENKNDMVHRLLVWTTVGSVLCILPPTAVLLMGYQTGFYGYEWIWSIVPVTICLACGGTVLLEQYVFEAWKDGGKEKLGCIGFVLLLAMVVVLGGGMGTVPEGVENTAEGARKVYDVLGEVKSAYEDSPREAEEAICLWAPREILQYIRALDGEVTLLYGANMWDRYLDGYTYDTYDETEKRLFLWMERMAGQDTAKIALKGENATEDTERENGRDGDLTFAQALALAKDKGVNVILFPETVSEELTRLQEELQLEIQRIDGYYLVML